MKKQETSNAIRLVINGSHVKSIDANDFAVK
jgi:hypothetical protein